MVEKSAFSRMPLPSVLRVRRLIQVGRVTDPTFVSHVISHRNEIDELCQFWNAVDTPPNRRVDDTQSGISTPVGREYDLVWMRCLERGLSPVLLTPVAYRKQWSPLVVRWRLFKHDDSLSRQKGSQEPWSPVLATTRFSSFALAI